MGCNFLELRNIKLSQVLALLSVLLFSFWIMLMFNAAPRFQEAVGTDSLAMINVLFPNFWIILVAYVGICFVTFVKSNGPSWLHMLLIGQISVILYFTPFVLSGFSWSPDSLWHGGVARYMPEILSGSEIALSSYAQTYPFSFLITYFADYILGINIFTYSLYVYPFIVSLVISVLAYIFAVRVFNHKVAFLSILLTLPALHYFEPHISPFSVGTILVLTSLILLTFKNRLALGLTFVSVIILTVTHPISPISLGAYIFAYIVIGFLFRRELGMSIVFSRRFLLPLLFFIGIIWFSWTVFYAMSYYSGIETAVISMFNFNFITRIFQVSGFTVGGQGFIFPQIHQLSLAIYGVFLALTLFPFIGYLKRVLLRIKTAKFNIIMYDKMALSLAAIINAIIGFLLFLSSGERFLLGRGLFYFIFFGSMVIATYFVSSGQISNKTKKILAFVLVTVLVCSFPVISYSKEAYNSYTPSAGAGLSFLSTKVDLSQNSLSMGMDQQIGAYANLSQGLVAAPFPPNMTDGSPPDVIVMRINAYYVISMRYDFSFTNNSYNDLKDDLTVNTDFNMIYANPRFEIYLNSTS